VGARQEQDGLRRATARSGTPSTSRAWSSM
jgi:hypothetical protein